MFTPFDYVLQVVIHSQPHKQPRAIPVKLIHAHLYTEMHEVIDTCTSGYTWRTQTRAYPCNMHKHEQRHSLDCMTLEVLDSCSVHRFHPSSRSSRLLNSLNCNYIPSFLQFKDSGYYHQHNQNTQTMIYRYLMAKSLS